MVGTLTTVGVLSLKQGLFASATPAGEKGPEFCREADEIVFSLDPLCSWDPSSLV